MADEPRPETPLWPIYTAARDELAVLGISPMTPPPGYTENGAPDFPVFTRELHLLESGALLALMSLTTEWLDWLTAQITIRDAIKAQARSNRDEAVHRATIAIEREYVGRRLTAAMRNSLVAIRPEVIAASESFQIATTVLEGYKDKHDFLRGALYSVQAILRVRDRRRDDLTGPIPTYGTSGPVRPVAGAPRVLPHAVPAALPGGRS